MKKVAILILALAIIFTGCKNKDESLIRDFLEDYYAYIEKLDDDNVFELAGKEIEYGEDSVLKKYLDEKTVGILVADREYLSVIYQELGLKSAVVDVKSIKKENDYYEVEYDLTFPDNKELVESYKISLLVDGDQIKIRSGHLGPSKKLQEMVKPEKID